MAMAWVTSRPARTSSSSVLSRLAESLRPSCITDRIRPLRVGKRPDSRSASRAAIHARLPSMVLISPLWAASRNGWARVQVGKVFVL